jgi:exodeoxyribonuclease VII large subunit
LGLVTSTDSAAYGDVLRTLRDGGVGFSILCCDARMQGEDTSRTVRAALLAVAAQGPDCILLVRGGGSRIDLSWFDREDIARAVAACPVPVLTGIGHEIDTSVADLVAHRAFKTPTAVAEFLVATAREACREVEMRYERIVACAQETLVDERQSLLDAARGLRSAAAGAVQSETSALHQSSQQLRIACEAGLFGAADALTGLRERLVAAARALLERSASRLDLAEQRARLLDPKAVLARGFAWLRRADGSLLKDAAAATAGETLTAVLRDGELGLRTLPRTTPGGP